ncbi:MAG: anhydro-N-acetylmuramic acid kinase, partial [Nodularia sp. (in: cyanobacteria)]|nr:anhydro-N-acetylmuramic acid kinase [Nodularia sp. (in: cyanobacteria)]
DINAGGHGAPLVPRVDAFLLSDSAHGRCIQNIGGIGNVAYIPPRGGDWLSKIRGWDTGPGNSLLDLAVQYLTDGAKSLDENGNWAASGIPCDSLVEQWLKQDYFHLPPPKSTGRELFGVAYLHQCLKDAEPYQLNPADLLATLTELTVATIAHSYQTFLPQMPQQVLLCGGGSRNLYLKQRLQLLLPLVPVLTTDEVGLNADFKEAIAFAVLAYWRQMGLPGNLPAATGAPCEIILGEIHST